MTLNDTPEQLVTPRQVAEALGFRTARPIYRMIREGKFPAARIGSRLLIDQNDVEAVLVSSRANPRRLQEGGLRALERYGR